MGADRTKVTTLHTAEDVIRDRGVTTVTELAKRLGTSRKRAFDEMFHLSRMGRVEVVKLGPSSPGGPDETTWRWRGEQAG